MRSNAIKHIMAQISSVNVTVSKIARAHKLASAMGVLTCLWELHPISMAEPRSWHMQQSPAFHLKGMHSGDAWMIYDMLSLECLKVPRCTASLFDTVTMHGNSVIYSYSTQFTPSTYSYFVHICCNGLHNKHGAQKYFSLCEIQNQNQDLKYHTQPINKVVFGSFWASPTITHHQEQQNPLFHQL